MIVSVSFQFVGFLLTYVLHTTHAAKYGSRVGLGITLIQFGLNTRSKAEELISSGEFPSDPSDPTPNSGANEDETAANNALKAFWGPGSPWPATVNDPDQPVGSPPVVLHNSHEAELFAAAHNTTLSAMLGLPNAIDVGRANEYFSFLLMSIGWFLVLTSIGGWWRVKRFERGLRSAQRNSEAAQAAANRGDTDPPPLNIETTSNATVNDPGPMAIGYYTSAFGQAWRGARDIQRGFLGMNGRPLRGGAGRGHTQVPTDEHELLDAQGFGLGNMASEGGGRRVRGLWGV